MTTLYKEELPLCECGCDKPVAKIGNRFIHGHNARGISNPHTSPTQIAADEAMRKPLTSPAQIAANDARRGVPRTPETIAKMSVARLGVLHTSDEQIAADKSQRGGDDLVEHHYIYDHSDLTKNTVKMTRSDHSKLHQLLKKLGYKVSHINMEEE